MVKVMRTHEAGALHSDGYGGAPQWLPYPPDVNALLPILWPAGVAKGDDGVLTVRGLPVTDIAKEFGTPAYVLDEDDFRARARAFRVDFGAPFADLGGLSVYYAGKAFLCAQVARWVLEEGLNLDVCSGGELAVAERVGFPGERIELHGNNKSAAEIEAAVTYRGTGVGRIVLDSFDEIERVAQAAGRLGIVVPVMIRVTVGVEAHTHEFIATAHEDQKFGFSLAGRHAAKAVAQILACAELDLRGLHSHIGSQIFDTAAFEVAARRVLGLHSEVAAEHGRALPELCLGGGFGIAYTSENTPLGPRELGDGLASILRRECAAEGIDVPAVSIEPGRAIAGPSTFTIYEVGTVKDVELDGGGRRAYVSVDGGMSDNVRTALYGADYSVTMANRAGAGTPMLSRVVGKHCESGDVVVMDEYLPSDVRPGDLIAVPGTGAYCRALSSQYNHVPRPPVVAVRPGPDGRGQARLIVRRESIEDILGLDLDD